jgi:hypothetical protein
MMAGATGTEFARLGDMAKPALNRPPRTRRPPEVVRHVDESMDAYRRVQAGRKVKPAAPAIVRGTDRT